MSCALYSYGHQQPARTTNYYPTPYGYENLGRPAQWCIDEEGVEAERLCGNSRAPRAYLEFLLGGGMVDGPSPQLHTKGLALLVQCNTAR